MKVNFEVELDECPYWNYETHKGRHTCGSCRCMSEGNNLENAARGVRIGDDRYCTLHTNILASLVKAIDNEQFIEQEKEIEMAKADNKLLKLGFVLVNQNESSGIWIYENGDDDQRVEINFDGEKWIIHSSSISIRRDWFGDNYHEPIALTYDEMKAFMEKIDELKSLHK